MQAAGLIKALHRHAERCGRSLQITGLAGQLAETAGCQLFSDTTSMGAVGLLEPLPYVLPGLRTLRRTLSILDAAPPDIAVLIDYPGINLPLARRLRQRFPIPIVYYIPPEEWIWSTKGNQLLDRSHKIPALTDKVLALYPLEADFYRGIGCDVELVGHPLQDVLDDLPPSRQQARETLGLDSEQKVVALFPASRRQELHLVWPVIAAAAARVARVNPELVFLLPLASEFLRQPLRAAVAKARDAHPELRDRLRLMDNDNGLFKPSALAIAAADLAISKSGTVTLELALRGVPQVAVYRLSKATIWLGRRLLRMTEADIVNTILVNHIMQQTIVPELLLEDSPPATIAEQALRLLPADAPERRRQLAGYASLRTQLGGKGAVDRAAQAVLALC